ncbi:fungal-specific transcription factor domain-containing protein [Talaromyces proteolyticus]|uniref:Fungal-specific transcription factor domain-containing protein n=1 Tax=Talaromyces proteolyticus TaxID=1131652 RepID=A0AAD4PZ60_9EURO|nr:fungal-specific transcription factor domain-containing protein [Talaromyces proteolyticus]KAH8698681.1 fungal-specific transcription factor domain-containing protein [Talaromyces proteolyticus]
MSTARLRSCVTCRSRKVRCDKQSPCSNCRRANIACVVPSTDRPPRWARRLDRITNNAASASDPRVNQVMERLHTLEGLVKELSGQLEQANATANSTVASSSGDTEPPQENSSNTSPANVQNKFGRLVLQDASSSRYISSGFWSRVGYELDELKMDTNGLPDDDSDSSDDDLSAEKTTPATSTQEATRTPSERHAFMFGHNLNHSVPNLDDFRPFPSQIPFLLDIFSENVNVILQIVHMPTVKKLVRDLRTSDKATLTPANEALLFSIYYAAVTSMDDQDVITNFGFTKTDLNLRYRMGLEYALAKADFLNTPSVALTQALTIFLFLLRLHESPAFVWMMTGLAIRMAQAIGLHRDGANLKHLKPYKVEMRRRVWWALCMLDIRASENQGTDLTISNDSFDTKLPLNINDADIDPDSDQPPTEREGITDTFFARISYESCYIMRQMTGLIVKDGPSDLERQSHMLNELYQIVERNRLKYWTESTSVVFWVMITCTRLVIAKMTLLTYLPSLFFSPNEHFSDEVRAKLFTSAIEVAEYNHTLNSEPKCRQWRWIFLTYTHWYAIVYLAMEISRRPWSPMVERAWVALHSSWLIPSRFYTDKNMRIWVPLRKLMSKAKQHRDSELERLRANATAAKELAESSGIPVPTSSGPFSAESDAVGIFRNRWWQLLNTPDYQNIPISAVYHGLEPSGSSIYNSNPPQLNIRSMAGQPPSHAASTMNLDPTYLGSNTAQPRQEPGTFGITTSEITLDQPELLLGQLTGKSNNQLSNVTEDLPYSQNIETGFMPWSWADAEPSFDSDAQFNWLNWIESAKSMDWERDGTN